MKIKQQQQQQQKQKTREEAEMARAGYCSTELISPGARAPLKVPTWLSARCPPSDANNTAAAPSRMPHFDLTLQLSWHSR